MPAFADSFITLPILPVSSIFPVPGIAFASISNVSPPTLVHAKPRATPKRGFSLALRRLNFSGPRYFSIFLSVTVTFFVLPESISTTAFRQSVPIVLSSCLTPASLV